MKIGLLADIHEDNHHLRIALRQFQRSGVDQVVVLGDICEVGERLDETCRLLSEADAVGVWGNHDYGLTRNPPERVRRRYSDHVLEFMASLQPRQELDGCLLTHVEPWLDPENYRDLWYFKGPPDTAAKIARSFDAFGHSIMFLGHFHRWLVATPIGLLNWNGEEPILLAKESRRLVVIAAVCDGRYATFDTSSGELVPYNA